MSPEQIRNLATREARQGIKHSDAILLSEMMIFLRMDFVPSYNPRGMKMARGTKNNRVYHFTRKHHDPVTGDCMNYENRPRMCRNYPYGKKCGYSGCAMTEAKCEKQSEF
jgi:hypothetical protein